MACLPRIGLGLRFLLLPPLLPLLLLLCARGSKSLPAATSLGRPLLALHEGRCGRPMPVENAEVTEGDQTGTRLRYSCVKNYKRKAGTSSLIVCREDEKTKTFQWTPAQLQCIRDPSLPESTTEDSRRVVMTTSTPGPEETETSTPAPPKTAGVNPLGSRSISQTASSPGTALPGTSTPVQEASLPYSPGSVPGNATVWEAPATTQVSELRTSKHTPAGHRETDVPPKGATGSPPQLSNPDSPQGLTESLSKRIGILFGLLVLILFPVLLYLYKKSYFRCSRNDRPAEEIPMDVREPVETQQSCSAADASEEAQMLPPQCSTSTG